MMRTTWAALRLAGRWLGPLLVVAAAGLLIFLPMPFARDEMAQTVAIAGAILSAIAALFAHFGGRSRARNVLALFALVPVLAIGSRLWDDHRHFTVETVAFENRGAHIAGSLYLPKRPGKVPGIVWVHGSGPMTRNMALPYAVHFAREGYAVLILDKRGVGQSTGHFEFDTAVSPANLDLLASDAAAGLELLAHRREVRPDAVGFFGVSQAGWVTPRAAALSGGRAAFMLLLSGPVTSTHTQMRYERFHIGAFHGDPHSMAFVRTALNAFGRGDIPAGLSPDQADALAQQRPLTLPYADYDPAADLRALNIPGLWLLGDEDWMVPSGPTARKLDALRALGKPYEYRNIPGAYHGMLWAPPRPVLDSIDAWLARVTAPRVR